MKCNNIIKQYKMINFYCVKKRKHKKKHDPN